MKKAEATRLDILQKAFELIYQRGYQATSVNDILATTDVTKGAFYFHFKTKDEMGKAIIEELLKPQLKQSFLSPLQSDPDPVRSIYTLIHDLLLDNKFLKQEFGCPVANFTQEMAPWNKAFRSALNTITAQWEEALLKTIRAGKRSGYIRKDVNPAQVAGFVMAGYWGIRNFGKLHNNPGVYKSYLKELKQYLESLR